MALDFSDWCGFNFRASNVGSNWPPTGGGDATNEFGLIGNPQTTVYPTDPDKGWLISSVGATNGLRNVDRRIYGFAQATGATSVFAINAPSADFDLRLVMGHATVANTRTGVVVVDTLDTDLTSLTGFLTASGTVTANNSYISSDSLRVYKATTGGAYTGDVTGTGSNIQAAGGGVARFKFLGYVVHIYDTGASPTIPISSVVDIDGSVTADSTWPSAPAQKRISIQNGGLKVLKHPSAFFYPRHIALKMVTTPLQAVDLRDHTGTTLGSNPSIHAGQPTGKLLAKLYFATGSTANITLGGTLAAYFQVVTKGSDKWLASLLPIPDGTTGTLQIIQTDTSTAITGSPFTTTFSTSGGTLTIVSSQGKPTALTGVSKASLALALISTQCWLNHKLVRDTVEAAWDGYSNQTIAHEYLVANETDLGNAITAANAAVGAGVWQAITITGGTYTSRTWTTADYSQGGTGGLLVRATGAHSINGWIDSGGWRGVHFDNLTIVAGGSQGIAGSVRSQMDHEVVITNCTLGTAGNTTFTTLLFRTGKSLKVRNNVFSGFEIGMFALAVRAVEIGYNDFRQYKADNIDISVFDGNPSNGVGKGVLVDDHVYVWCHDNQGRDGYDNWSGYTTNDEPHTDFLQTQISVNPWVTGTVYPAGRWVVNDSKYYQTAAGGTSGATAPTHTSGDVSDGGVTWTYKGDFATGPRLFLSLHGSRLHGSSTTYSDVPVPDTTPPGGKFIAGLTSLIADSSTLPLTASVFNNICASRSTASGWYQGPETNSPAYVEYNTLVGPAYCPDYPSPGTNSTKPIVDDMLITGSQVFARKNIVGSVQSVALDEDNLTVSFKGSPDPNLKLRGPFTQPNALNTIWGYDLDETGTAFSTSLESFVAPLPANSGYGAVTQAVASATRRNGGLSLGLRLGL